MKIVLVGNEYHNGISCNTCNGPVRIIVRMMVSLKWRDEHFNRHDRDIVLCYQSLKRIENVCVLSQSYQHSFKTYHFHGHTAHVSVVINHNMQKLFYSTIQELLGFLKVQCNFKFL